MSRPIVTILVGMPPIAWIVLAMIWFGMSDTTVIFTVVIASFPIVFVGALQGTRTLEGNLKQMADSFNLPFKMKMFDLYFPHIFSSTKIENKSRSGRINSALVSSCLFLAVFFFEDFSFVKTWGIQAIS